MQPDMPARYAAALDQVGPRLKQLRRERGGSLAQLARAAGVSSSTLSRLEAGRGRPDLQLLLAIADVYRVPLDVLVGVPDAGDPRVQAVPVRRGGRSVTPLGHQPGGVPIFRLRLPSALSTVRPQVHEGSEWLLVLSGRLRIVLGDDEFVLGVDEAAEYDPRVPHGFASDGEGPVEFLGLFGPEGQRQHVTLRRPAPEPS